MFILSEVAGYYELANRQFIKSMLCTGGKSSNGYFAIALVDGATNQSLLADYGKSGAKPNEMKRYGKL